MVFSLNIFDVVAEHLVPIGLTFVAAVVIYRIFSGSPKPSSRGQGGQSSSSDGSNADGDRFVVGHVDDLKDGEMKEVKLDGDAGSILLLRERGTYRATGSKCTHSSAPLAKGAFVQGRVRCPWHGACFNIETGDIEEMPGVDNLQTFPVAIDGEGRIVVTASRAALKEQWKRRPAVCGKSVDLDGRTFVVVGAGAAGFTCCETLRKEGFKGRIVLIGQEKHAPYDRTKLSKSMSATVDKMVFRPESFFDEAQIETLFGVECTGVNVEQKFVSLSNGQNVSFDKIFVAPGAVARTLNVPGKDLQGIFCLRVPEDASQIAVHLNKDRDLVIVGSSFIGMETASILFDKVRSVSVIGMEKVPFERVLGSEIGAALQRFHEEKGGIKFYMERVVREFQGEGGRVTGVVLDNGVRLTADLVVMGAGVVPSTSFLPAASFKKERDQSILADEFLCAAPDVFVGGDIARYPFHMAPPGSTVRIEHLGMAMHHGTVAARNMLQPQSTPERSIPFFWTSQYGKSVRYCGHALSYDRIIVDGDLQSLKFVAFYVNKGVILAAASVDRDPAVAKIAELMNVGQMPTAEEILAEQAGGKITLKGKL